MFLISDNEQSLNRIEKRSGGNNGEQQELASVLMSLLHSGSYICTQTITSKGSDGVTTKTRLPITTQQYEVVCVHVCVMFMC